ncbi:MAG: hypothetical protein IPK26_17005 [Planctomycetes bacterium]|nr:hypothetical protein [Planctomycetota bacterium]
MSVRSILMTLPLLAACGGDTKNAPVAVPASPALQAMVLPSAPAGAIDVRAALAAAVDAPMTVRGRVAAITKGQALVQLMDLSVPYCGEKSAEDGCKTPWDYCCETPETLRANRMVVEFRGADGKPIATPSLPDIQLLDAITVQGRLLVDEHGNRTLVGTGLFRSARPELPADLNWPQ